MVIRALNRTLLTAVLFMAVSPLLTAATYIVPVDQVLIEKAATIARGRVLSVTPVENADSSIHTEITVMVERSWKGSSLPSSIVIRQPGGRVGDRMEVYPGIGSFAVGEAILVMLDPDSSGSYRLVDFALGKFHAGKTAAGIEFYRRDGLTEAHIVGGATLDRSVRGEEFVDSDRDAPAFERFIEEIAAGRAAAADYSLSEKQEDVTVLGRHNLDFTLEGPPNGRWTEFQLNQAVTYKDSATGDSGSGCPTGCHSEVMQAITNWNGATGAKINLAYGGTDATIGSSCLSALSNEVQFGDPCGEITNLTGCTGSLAVAGYTVTSTSAGNFCAGIGNPSFSKITSARILVNNGTGACLNSCDYEDLISHQVGHTIGAGTSPNVGSVMFHTFTDSRCGVLQTDDIAFARCVYPGTFSTCPATTIASVTPKTKGRVLKAIVVGTGFSKGAIVQIDAGAGFVDAPATKSAGKKKVVGKSVDALWPAGVAVDIQVLMPQGCTTNIVTVQR